MLDFYRHLAHCLRSEAVVLATIIQTHGSVPREVGAKMLIQSDGATVGTIGGGAGEALVIQTAQHILATGKKQHVTIDLSGSATHNTHGVCGGTAILWLERWHGTAMHTLASQIVAALAANQPVTLVTPLCQQHSPHLTNTPPHPTPHLTDASFTETLQPPPTLLIVGAGHCAIPLAHLAHIIGFRVVVQDDRSDFATPERFPEATAVIAQPIATALATLDPSPQLYAALVTRGYQWDLTALKALLQRPTCYIGMIGSRQRIKTVFHALCQEPIPGIGIVSKATLYRTIHAPIGLDIGARTPEEIAVSICAQLIQVRNRQCSRPNLPFPLQI
jgi:xanthine dehydrogenase accessory factor